MDTKKREDLRVRKTKQTICGAFKEMICEMDLGEITIKELTLRAQINRKTFYLHYQCLDDVMTELEDEIANNFIKRKVSYANMRDIRNLVRLFFESAANMPLLHERLICNESYRSVWSRINEKVMRHRMATNRGVFGVDEYRENLIFAYFGANSTLLYRQWVEDGKRLPLEDLIEMSTKLICEGMSGVVKS